MTFETQTIADHPHRVHEFLLSAAAHPANSSPVAVKETHISWVYITDRYVYKQKKPVRFDFLDFSTLAQRKHFCEQEVELNRRFSPGVYLGAVPVTQSADGTFQIRKGHKPVEWLVKMKRLDDRLTLENLIRRNQLKASQVSLMSQHLAKMYCDQAPEILRSSDFLSRLLHHVQANASDLLKCVPNFERLVRFSANAQSGYLNEAEVVFNRRVADGRIVDGHGDLRPEHIYLQNGQPRIIDCIEFNTEYRVNDVVDELAFLAMECERLGAPQVGTDVISAYLSRSADHPPTLLLQFYKCYRACVRAKIAALRAAQEPEPQPWFELTHTYLDLAERYAQTIACRRVLIVGGKSGTGKSTLSRSLQKRLSATLLQTDVVRRELFASTSNDSRYTPENRKLVYDHMLRQAEQCVASSPTLILDGTFYSSDLRQRAFQLGQRLGAKVLQIQCECPLDTALSRIADRQRQSPDESEATATLRPRMVKLRSICRQQQLTYEQPSSDMPIVFVDTTTSVAEQMETVLGALRKLG